MISKTNKKNIKMKNESNCYNLQYIICCGMYRSASTWQYNIACEIVEMLLGGERIGFVHWSEFDDIDNRDTNKPLILKTHDYHQSFSQLLKSNNAKAIYSYRDFRDVFCSLMWKLGYSFEELINNEMIQTTINSFYAWTHQPNVLVQNYNDIVSKPEKCIKNIANFLNLSPQTSLINALSKKYSLEENIKRAKQLEKELNEKDLDLDLKQNKILKNSHTEIHWNHFRVNKDKSWKSILSLEQQKLLLSKINNFLIISTNNIQNCKSPYIQSFHSEIVKTIDDLQRKDFELKSKDTQLQSLMSIHALKDQQIQSLTADLATRDTQLQSLTADLASKDSQLQSLTADLASKDSQLQFLTADLANRDQMLQSLQNELNEIKISKAWRFALTFRNMRYKLAPPNSPQTRLLRKTYQNYKLLVSKARRHWHWIKYRKLVSQSGLFDPDWYLQNYPDVAEKKISPLKHFLIHGGFEGRDPGPTFNNSKYITQNIDVKLSGLNPLLHYILFGFQEGRIHEVANLDDMLNDFSKADLSYSFISKSNLYKQGVNFDKKTPLERFPYS